MAPSHTASLPCVQRKGQQFIVYLPEPGKVSFVYGQGNPRKWHQYIE